MKAFPSRWSLPACLMGIAAATSCGCADSPPSHSPAGNAGSSAVVAPPAASDANHSISSATTNSSEERSVQPVTPATTPQEQSKPKREPIYNSATDAKADIAAALDVAKKHRKHVLITWGANWCGWCYKLHGLLENDPDCAQALYYEYVPVLVDIDTHRELLAAYDPVNEQHSYPFLTVLNADGEVLVNQFTEPLEAGSQHDPRKVKAFLEKWKPDVIDAEQQLTAAFDRARSEDKRVIVHLGTPSCGWCRVLEKFLHDQEAIIGRDYVDLKIDLHRMAHGEEVGNRLRKARSSGVPWIVILDEHGNELATSDGPEGNCGYPYEPHEIEHFLSMLRATARRIDDSALAELEATLNAYREESERKRAERNAG